MMGVVSRPTAVLAVQGAFAEHEAVLKRLGERTLELRQAGDLDQPFDRLILPGSESTTQSKLLAELGMLEPLRARIESGMPVLATCTGLILLAHRLDAHDDTGSPRLATMDVCVRRNGYGRQLGSFHTECEMNQVAPDNQEAYQIPMTFIRAPYICETGDTVEVLARVDKRTVAVRQGTQLGVAFHPELDDDTRIHELFLSL